MKIEDVSEISLYKRDVKSIEDINYHYLKIDGNKVEIDAVNNIIELDKINSFLNKLLSLTEVYLDSEYRCQLYEYNKDDLMLKFFLAIKFKNKTYLAIKGNRPFNQPNYKEILEILTKLFNL